MNLINKLRIGPRLALAFGVVILLMGVIVAIGVNSLRSVGGEIDLLVNDRVLKVKLVNEVIDLLNLQARESRNALLFDEADQREEAGKAIDKAGEDIAQVYAKLEPMLASAEGKKMFADLMKERDDFRAALQLFLRQVKAGDVAGAKGILFDRLRPQQLEYMKQLYALAAFQEKLMDDSSASTQQAVKSASWLMLAAAALALLIAVFAGFAVARSVTRPVAGLVGNLQSVADGDLTVEVQANRSDEIGQLQQALAHTVERLRQVVGQVRSGVDSVTTASSQIAAGNHDLSQRTEEQASSLQETASSMEQLNSTVRQSADNAQQANQLASSASVAAARGGEVVGGVVSTMEAISSSSRRIADIIGTIDGIAFQTNILALNAAVEAARAGEQGRGFAVVAGEVRLLAQRSAEAAKEIKSLIGSSVEQVEAGTRQVAEAGGAMQDIVQQVRKVSDLINEIASASQEQSSGIGQVNQAVAQMDQVTQQNAALVEESAAAAASLAQQATRLAEAVSVFQVGTHSAKAPAPRVSTPPKPAPAQRPSAAPKPARPVVRPQAKSVAASSSAAPQPAQSDNDEWTSF